MNGNTISAIRIPHLHIPPPVVATPFPGAGPRKPGRGERRPGEVGRTTMHPRLVTALVAALIAAAAAAPSGTAAQRPPPFAESGVLTVGARGPAVRALQRELRSR